MTVQHAERVYILPSDQSLRDAVVKAAYLARRAGESFSIQVPGAGRLWPIQAKTGTVAIRNHVQTLHDMLPRK